MLADLDAEEGDKKGSAVKLIAVGRLAYEKGFDLLLRALKKVSNRGVAGWELNILGNGSLREELEKLNTKLELENQVHFLGHVPNPYPYMARSDLFVHASRWEGFGMVIVEALALGVPVIATSCPGGPKEILDSGGYGRLVPPENLDALAEAIEELIINPEERKKYGELGRRRVGDYRPERIAERILEIERYVLDDMMKT
jgi:glycosyltransferase involved in cell wall biosynthesis